MKKYKSRILIIIAAVLILAASFYFAPSVGVDNHVAKKENSKTNSADVTINSDLSANSDASISSDGKKADKHDAETKNKEINLLKEAKPNMTAEEKLELASQLAKITPGSDNSISYSNGSQESKPASNGSDSNIESLPKGENNENKGSENTEKSENHKPKCILSVRCDTILNNMELLNSEKKNLIPKDGIIYAEKEVEFNDGETVFNVLLREMKQNKIHLEFVNTPVFKTAYIEGISNIYELDCGELSGWMYKVNGWFPNYGCSNYFVKNGDVIEWVYTCNLGIDVGGYYSSENGGQRDE